MPTHIARSRPHEHADPEPRRRRTPPTAASPTSPPPPPPSRTILRPDIAVIGAGSGGLSVAAAAAAFGVDVVLIEKGKMGGDCLNYGCVPSKAVIAAAKHAHAARSAPKFGVDLGEPKVDYAKVHEHVQDVIAQIAPNDSEERFTAMGVHVIRAAGRFTNPDTIVAGGTTIKPRRIVVATGSTALVPPIPGLKEVDYLTNESLFELKVLPEHLIVIGGGPIGMEMAQAHRRLGSKVTVLEGGRALRQGRSRAGGHRARQHPRRGRRRARGRDGVRGRARRRRRRRHGSRPKAGEEVVTGSHILVATGRKRERAGIGTGGRQRRVRPHRHQGVEQAALDDEPARLRRGRRRGRLPVHPRGGLPRGARDPRHPVPPAGQGEPTRSSPGRPTPTPSSAMSG